MTERRAEGARRGERPTAVTGTAPDSGPATADAARVRLLRTRLDLSQSKLAARLGVSFASVNRWENGQSRPSPRARGRIARLEAGVKPRDPVALLPSEANEPVSSPTNLPVAPNPTVGRDEDVVRVGGLLDRHRLVTLTGPGGVGKTRLALEVARNVAPDFPDGVWLVELASSSSPDLLPSAIAAALGIPIPEGLSRVAVLTSALAARSLLLVLDNCEHLIEGVAPLVDALLRSSSGLRILVTSRELLEVESEVVWPVPPLSTASPRGDERSPPLVLAPAAQLFAERAACRRSDFVVHFGNLDAVVGLCERLDGLPLAIELVAGQLDRLSLEEIAERLDRAMDRLPASRRGGPPRQRSLRAVVDWSFNLLGEKDRRVFERLGVFVGPFDVAAAEAVTADDHVSDGEVLDLLAGLVRKSLVQILPDGERTRYRLLHTLRDDARGRLVERGELEVFRLRHAAYYRALAAEAGRFLYRREQGAWLDRLDREVDELRLARETLIEQGELEAALRLAASLGRFWIIRGYLDEGFSALERLLACRGTMTPATRLAALRVAAIVARELEKLDEAQAWCEEQRCLARQLGDDAALGWALANLATVEVYRGDAESPVPLLVESRERFHAAGDEIGIGWATGYLGHVRGLRNETVEATSLTTDALARFRAAGDTFGIAWALGELGAIELGRGDELTARRLFESGLVLAQQIGARYLIGAFLQSLGALTTLQPSLLRRSLELRYGIRDPRGVAVSLLMVVCVGAARGDWSRVIRLRAAVETACPDFPNLFATLRARDQVRIATGVRAARAALGEVAFAIAWTEGSLLTLSEAVQLAREMSPAPDLNTPAAFAVPEPYVDSGMARGTEPSSVRLTRREKQVLDQVATGVSNAEIARELGISARTVGRHLTTIYAKLGVANRAGATACALRRML